MTPKKLYPSTVLKFIGLMLGSILILTIPVIIFFSKELRNSTIVFNTILFVSFISISIGYAHYRNIKNNTPIIYHFKINNISLLPLLIVILATYSLGMVIPVTGIIGDLLNIVDNQSPLDTPLLTLGAFLLAPIFEEVLFRGILLRGLTSTYAPKKAVILSALIFAFIHLNPVQFLPALVVGLFFGFIYLKTNSLGLVILLHFTVNFTASIGSYLSFRLHDENSNAYFNSYGNLTVHIVGTCFFLFAIFCYIFYTKIGNLEHFAE